MRKIRVGIIGTGHLGSRHIDVYSRLTDEAELTAICDTDAGKARALSERYRVPYETDYRRLAGRVEAVVVCVPTSAHFAVARFFLERDTHTFIEKPVTSGVVEAEALIRLAETRGLKLQVGHVERFNAAFEAARHFARRPLFIECHRLSPFPNRSLDIGVVMDLMIHDLDIVLGLNRCPVEDFHAVGVNVLTPLEDIASVRLLFANGCVCNLTASRVSDEVMRKIRVFLPDAYISLDSIRQEAFIYRKDRGRILKHALPVERGEPLRKEAAAFLRCIREDTEPAVPGAEARDALDLAVKIATGIRSHARGLFQGGRGLAWEGRPPDPRDLPWDAPEAVP